MVDILKGTTFTQNLSITFRNLLAEVILSAIIFDHDLTMRALTELNYANDFFKLVLSDKLIFRSYYERKLFVFSLSKLVFMYES